MSIISKNAAAAFHANRRFNNSNTQVTNANGESSLFLWGNRIAWTSDNGTKLHVNQCGWDTRTTNDRLRALGVDVYHNRGTCYINGQQARAYDTVTMAHTWRI